MYNPEALNAAFNKARYNRSVALQKSVQRKEEVVSSCPEIEQIGKKLSAIGASIAKVFFSEDPKKGVEELAKESLALQQRRKQLLKDAGFPEDYLEPPFKCKKCKDTGRVDGKICECIKKSATDIALKDIAKIAPVDKCSFENFNLDFYKNITDKNGNSVYDKSKNIYEYMKAYSENFTPSSKSLYIFGKTGLGKTHLTLAAVKKIVEKGYYVLYGSASAVLTSLEEEKFKGVSGKYTLKKIEQADLVVIDDLGSEFSTSFTAAAVHNIVESRLLAGKPVIITTNLDINGINSLYGERICSRIIGEYEPIMFDGQDIRQLKKFQY